MALTTEARAILITAFSGLGYRIYDTVPGTPITPSVVIVPDSPWIVPSRLGSTLNYRCLAQVPNNFSVESVTAPQLLSLGAQGTVISTEINLSIEMKE